MMETDKTRHLKILVVNGPNLRLLGRREPGIYGRATLNDIEAMLRQEAARLGVEIEFYQSDVEGELVRCIGEAVGRVDGLIINPAAYTHTSVALRDAIAASSLPCVEVHLSNTAAREPFRHQSLTAPVCIGQIMGLGVDGYRLALDGLAKRLREGAKASRRSVLKRRSSGATERRCL